eukprot:TRINITY_DN6679_c0_g1_i2.p1 TRINITY_DN6679_c0_g1~~TRINITY_DN6679_c0_g1_i2.p1  ORF type:complete len:623 (+),score=175.63 TRINITY_DN6679_c0_g1_i2:2094-3962(+)
MSRRVLYRLAGAAAAGFGAASAFTPIYAEEANIKLQSKKLYEGRLKAFNEMKDLSPIDELSYTPTARYREASKEEVLYPLIEKSDVLMVAGAFFGDEGKGKTVDAIATHPKVGVVVRVNSGENAGHTVFDSATGTKYVFHLAPSGLLIPGKVNLVGPECVMDPISFFREEISQLVKNDVNYLDRLYVGNCHIVTPYHKLLDLLASGANASTLKGMSPVHASKAKKRGIRMDHIYNDRAVAEKRLAKDMEDYFAFLSRSKMTEEDVLELCKSMNRDMVRIQPYIMDFVTAKDKVKYLMDLYEKEVINNSRFPKRGDVSHMIRETLTSGKKVLVEGPQSYWLSNAAEKFWESSTSASTCAGGLAACTRFNVSDYKVTVLNIHKAPGSSRVGVGANPSSFIPQDFFSRNGIDTLNDLPKGTFDKPADFEEIHKVWMNNVQGNGIVKPALHKGWDLGTAMAVASSETHGECGATTKKPRICGLFDCVAHAEVNQVQGPYLSISALDRGDVYDKLGVIIAYVYNHPAGRHSVSNGRTLNNGDIIKAGDALPTEEAMKYCHPVVKTLSGWKDTPLYAGSSWWKNTKHPTELPKNVADFIDTIEHFTGAKVVSIGNGPKGDQIVYLSKI